VRRILGPVDASPVMDQFFARWLGHGSQTVQEMVGPWYSLVLASDAAKLWGMA
jgi:hypothetical protein